VTGSSPSLPSLLSSYLLSLQHRGLAAGTIALRRMVLMQLAGWLLRQGIPDVRRVTPEDLHRYQVHLATAEDRRFKAAKGKRLSRITRSDRMRHVRASFGWLVRHEVLLADPTLGCLVNRPPAALPFVLSEDQVRRLIEAPDPGTSIGIRDRAILELLYSTGLRRAELTALDVGDVDLAEGLVHVRSGKGGKARIVPLGARAARALSKYLANVRPLWQRFPGARALFFAAERCGQTGQRLSRATIWLVVKRAAKSAGLPSKVAPHALRHAVATHLLRAGADVRHVQELLGHAQVSTTEIYTHVAISDLRAVHARTHPRGRRR